jgi:cysteinyl-tRNA synthetase
MVRLDKAKMAKSVGNIFRLHDSVAEYGRDAMIMYFVGGHYRQPVEFDEERLKEAAARVRRVREAARKLVPGPSPEWSAPLRERFFDALADDFNTPEALARMFEWIREANRESAGVGDADLHQMLDVLGLANLLEEQTAEAPTEALSLLDEREQARQERDYAEADRLRAELRALGWEVRDSPDGPELLPVG